MNYILETRTIGEMFPERTEIDNETGCIEWTGTITQYGYGTLRYCKKPYQAHRFSWELTNGPIMNDLHVLHKCDNRCCVNPDHLFLGTHQDNMKDMANKGRAAKGEDHGSARLKEFEVIYVLEHPEERGIDLSRKFGVNEQTISNIRTGANWKYLTINQQEGEK